MRHRVNGSDGRAVKRRVAGLDERWNIVIIMIIEDRRDVDMLVGSDSGAERGQRSVEVKGREGRHPRRPSGHLLRDRRDDRRIAMAIVGVGEGVEVEAGHGPSTTVEKSVHVVVGTLRQVGTWTVNDPAADGVPHAVYAEAGPVHLAGVGDDAPLAWGPGAGGRCG